MFLHMPEQADQALAVLLKRLREERHVTQEQLAFDAGITASALSRIERGLNSPGWMTVKRIIEALDVTLIELATYLEGSCLSTGAQPAHDFLARCGKPPAP